MSHFPFFPICRTSHSSHSNPFFSYATLPILAICHRMFFFSEWRGLSHTHSSAYATLLFVPIFSPAFLFLCFQFDGRPNPSERAAGGAVGGAHSGAFSLTHTHFAHMSHSPFPNMSHAFVFVLFFLSLTRFLPYATRHFSHRDLFFPVLSHSPRSSLMSQPILPIHLTPFPFFVAGVRVDPRRGCTAEDARVSRHKWRI